MTEFSRIFLFQERNILWQNFPGFQAIPGVIIQWKKLNFNLCLWYYGIYFSAVDLLYNKGKSKLSWSSAGYYADRWVAPFQHPGVRPDVITPWKAGICLRFASKARERRFSALGGRPFSGRKMFTQTLHVLHVNTTVGHRDLRRLALPISFFIIEWERRCWPQWPSRWGPRCGLGTLG